MDEDLDITKFNNSEVKLMEDITPDELIKKFTKARGKMSDWLNQLSGDELEITGIHPAMGKAKLREMIKMVNIHNIMHLRGIKKVINR